MKKGGGEEEPLLFNRACRPLIILSQAQSFVFEEERKITENCLSFLQGQFLLQRFTSK
jgi:hypothetical protein